MTPTNDAAEIAAGLTEAQRVAIRFVSVDPTRVSPICSIPTGIRTFRALERRNLAAHHIVGMVSCVRLTPLGCAVRDHLAKAQD